MKRAKYIICLLVISSLIMLSGEVGQNRLSTFEDGTRYVLFSSGDIKEWSSFCTDIHSQCKLLEIDLFVKHEHTKGINASNIIIFTDNAGVIYDKYKVESGRYVSLFSGETNVDIMAFEQLAGYEIGSAKFYMDGDTESILSIYKFLNGKYGTSHIKKDMSNGMEDIYSITCVIALLIMLIMTLFDISFQKKETLVRLTMGESVWKIIIKNVCQDIITYAFMSALVGALLHAWISDEYYKNGLVVFTIILCVANSIVYVYMLRQNIKVALANNYSNEGLLFGCYILKIMTIAIITYAMAACFQMIHEKRDFLKQYDDVTCFAGYSNLDYKYYNMTDKTSELSMKYPCYTFREKYSELDVAFSVLSINYDNDTYLNVNQNANMVLRDITELDKINQEYKIHILIPKKLRDNEEYYVKNALDSGSCIYSDMEGLPYEVIYYSSAKVLYFDEDLVLNIGVADNPIVCYFTLTGEDVKPMNWDNPDNILHEFRNIMFRISEEELNMLSEELELGKNGFYVNCVNTLEKYENYKNQVLRKIFISSVICVLFGFLGAAITGTIIKLEYNSKAKELAIKKILGYSTFEKNKPILLSLAYSCGMGVLIVGLAGIMTRYLDVHILLAGACCIMLIESLMTLTYMVWEEQKTVVKILKGGTL